jgi:hypothetical protein
MHLKLRLGIHRLLGQIDLQIEADMLDIDGPFAGCSQRFGSRGGWWACRRRLLGSRRLSIGGPAGVRPTP